ncbi:hypothetical protein B0H67DRAFT_99537 [Lasiosphaeris hirsuta]|uniref:Uncharacterized protein n=1 Tax=Lasiosphaeris hirsuta TaxID=260670 RepID=A0AA40AY13_9PEZI|nr:hypothetical protein B0H67DRAFT_99537 [Lasiosphaeris hirsuta]
MPDGHLDTERRPFLHWISTGWMFSLHARRPTEIASTLQIADPMSWLRRMAKLVHTSSPTTTCSWKSLPRAAPVLLRGSKLDILAKARGTLRQHVSAGAQPSGAQRHSPVDLDHFAELPVPHFRVYTKRHSGEMALLPDQKINATTNPKLATCRHAPVNATMHLLFLPITSVQVSYKGNDLPQEIQPRHRGVSHNNHGTELYQALKWHPPNPRPWGRRSRNECVLRSGTQGDPVRWR